MLSIQAICVFLPSKSDCGKCDFLYFVGTYRDRLKPLQVVDLDNGA